MGAKKPTHLRYVGLGLRAGQEKLPAVKASGDWTTSPRALRLYRDSVGRE